METRLPWYVKDAPGSSIQYAAGFGYGVKEQAVVFRDFLPNEACTFVIKESANGGIFAAHLEMETTQPVKMGRSREV
jgi:hypothetical protein